MMWATVYDGFEAHSRDLAELLYSCAMFPPCWYVPELSDIVGDDTREEWVSFVYRVCWEVGERMGFVSPLPDSINDGCSDACAAWLCMSWRYWLERGTLYTAAPLDALRYLSEGEGGDQL